MSGITGLVFWLERRHEDRLRRVVRRRVEEAGPEVPECLGKVGCSLRLRRQGKGPAVGGLPAPAQSPGGNHAQNRDTENGFDVLRILDIRVEVLEDESQDHPAEEPGDAADKQVRRTLRTRRHPGNLGAVDDRDVRGKERRRDLGLAEAREEGAIEIAARVDLATQEVVFCHVVGQAPRL